jgi:uncharacterized protein YndB with AHSA1/START domain
MLTKTLIIVAVLVVVFVVIVAMRPSQFRIARSAVIAAPPEVVFAQVNDFHAWHAWSPWEKKDPAMKRTHEGPPSGRGAVYAWAGNKEVGEGRMTLIESRPAELIRIRLEFFKPFAATNEAQFTFTPRGAGGEQTDVTWSMTGHNGFMSKAFCMFMDMDKLVGRDFEKGLASMKNVAESSTTTFAHAAAAAH